MAKLMNCLAIFLALALLLSAGCVSQPSARPAPVPKEQLAAGLLNATIPAAPDLIMASGDDNAGVVRIIAKNVSGRWLFPMTDYDGQFETMGLYSSAFVMLNKTQVKWLDEGESIWLTLMKGNGSGVLFNAVYENDAVNCSSGQIRILGKDYPLPGLRQKSSFQSDDKWKVARDPDGACPKRVIIYLDGYFSGMKDNETISLFRNDNTVLLQFQDLENGPMARLITTKPIQAQNP